MADKTNVIKDKDGNVTVVINNCDCGVSESPPQRSSLEKFLFGKTEDEKKEEFEVDVKAGRVRGLSSDGTWDGSGTGPY